MALRMTRIEIHDGIVHRNENSKVAARRTRTRAADDNTLAAALAAADAQELGGRRRRRRQLDHRLGGHRAAGDRHALLERLQLKKVVTKKMKRKTNKTQAMFLIEQAIKELFLTAGMSRIATKHSAKTSDPTATANNIRVM